MSIRCLTAFAVSALACAALAQIEVNETNMNSLGWYSQTTGTATTGFASGPLTPPYGVGSGLLSVGSLGASGAHLRNVYYAGTRLDRLSALSYATFTYAGNGASPIMGLHVDFNGDSAVDDQLYFDPEYQHGYTSNVPDQGDNTDGVWHTWNAFTGGWWSLNGYGGLTRGAGVNTLAAYLAAKPDTRIVNTSTGLGGWRVFAGVSEGVFDNFNGYIDAVSIVAPGLGGFNDVYNFEPVPEPASLCALTLGVLAVMRRRRP